MALQKSSASFQVFLSWRDFLKIFVAYAPQKKEIQITDSVTYTPAQSFKDDRNCSLTFRQVFLLLMGVQPDAQLKGTVVGGTVVTSTPSAGFLQMYFSLLLQLTTSHSPANTPVVMATHPCFLSFIKQSKHTV